MAKLETRQAQLGDCEALARILVEATRDAFRGLVPDRCLNWISPEESAANWAKNFRADGSLLPRKRIIVAVTDTDEVVGLAVLGTIADADRKETALGRRFSHELRVLQVDPLWQRQGVGRLLVGKSAEELSREGASGLVVGVLAENPNLPFYQRLGAVRLGSRPYNWEGYETEELLYGWTDLAAIR